ncbi:MAG: hypothetical protein LBT33_04440 [Spirochaetia bacterium]|nr:hypothetical protein [Spirochaetia bacterium]
MRPWQPARRIADSFPKYVITMDEDLPRVTAGGIRCVRLKDFLAANV